MDVLEMINWDGYKANQIVSAPTTEDCHPDDNRRYVAMISSAGSVDHLGAKSQNGVHSP